ncbi:MAG: peptide chain release factor-like protein [Deltaproteobacteria bacterium]|nr:peptide chain release factor-like protein [Deltaproteobacteria bacterium]
MNMFTVSAEKETLLQERMTQLGVSEDELRETFVRSSGPGGQNVNKTSSCVQLVHVPTGLSVKCQQERSQLLNRFLARRLLLDRIERLQRGLVEAEKMRNEKIRRQKRKRSKRAKEKILQDKHHQAEKKVQRTRPLISDGA